jgi:hypothetical protein
MHAGESLRELDVAGVCLALSALAHADGVTITLDPNFSAPDYAFYTYTDTAGVVQSNIPVGPYMATLNGDGYNNTAVLVFCYDMASETNVGTLFSGAVEPVTSFTDPTYTEMMDSTFLINELQIDGGLNAPLATRGAISLAIWQIMNPTSNTKIAQFPDDPAAQPYIAQAAVAVGSGEWSTADADLYPTWVPEDTLIQRFGEVPESQGPVTPEPPTWTLTVLGVFGLALAGRRGRAFARKSVLSFPRPS